jgi:hypothetical protein
MYYKGEEIETINDGESLPLLTFEPGNCHANTNENFNLSTLNGITTKKPVSFFFQCYDIYNNTITHGGENFAVSGSVPTPRYNINLDNITIIDHNDGIYEVSFIPNISGQYLIRLFINKEKYGEDIVITYSAKECNGETPILCPNNNICAKDLYECITNLTGCPKEKPFKCKDKDECVKSRIECDCPLGHYKCSYMK